MFELKINGKVHPFSGDPEMPLLRYLRDEPAITGSRFGKSSPRGNVMKKLAATALTLAFWTLGAQADPAQPLTVTPNGSQPSAKGTASYFTGAVRVDAPFKATLPGHLSGATVTFEPGARTAWHTHPLGQMLIVTQGVGLVQEWGKPIQVIKAGDTVWVPPGVKHWHGASAETAMTHVAVVEQQDGKSVDWMELVSDQQYQNAP